MIITGLNRELMAGIICIGSFGVLGAGFSTM